MLLTYDQAPRAGIAFSVVVSRFVSPARLRFYVGASLEADEECIVEPCKTGILILAEWRDFWIRVTADDGAGAAAMLKLKIL